MCARPWSSGRSPTRRAPTASRAERVVAEILLADSALKRLLEPDEVAEAVAYLCTPERPSSPVPPSPSTAAGPLTDPGAHAPHPASGSPTAAACLGYLELLTQAPPPRRTSTIRCRPPTPGPETDPAPPRVPIPLRVPLPLRVWGRFRLWGRGRWRRTGQASGTAYPGRTRGRRRREAELTALFDTVHDLAGLRDLDDVLQAIVQRARRLLGTEVAVYDAHRHRTRRHLHAGDGGFRLGPLPAIAARHGGGAGGPRRQTARPTSPRTIRATPASSTPTPSTRASARRAWSPSSGCRCCSADGT